jgi:hypothetical protein
MSNDIGMSVINPSAWLSSHIFCWFRLQKIEDLYSDVFLLFPLPSYIMTQQNWSGPYLDILTELGPQWKSKRGKDRLYVQEDAIKKVTARRATKEQWVQDQLPLEMILTVSI